MYYSNYISPIGEMLIASDGESLNGLWFYGQKHFKSTIDNDAIVNNDLDIFFMLKNGWMIISMVKILKSILN